MKNAKPILAAVTVLAVLALIVRQVTQAVWHTFASPAGLAHVDRSTPLIQNGLTLLDVESVSSDRPYMYTDKGPQEIGGPTRSTSDDTGLWIQLPEGHFLPADCSSDNSGGEPALSISTRTSTGRSFPLHWTVMDNQAKAGLVLAFIPAGYPDSVQWMDVTFSDRIGHVATWRIQNLPRMQHVLRPPLTAQTDFRQKDVRVTATVYRQAEPSSNGQQNVLSFDVKGDVSKPVYQWELGSLRANREWEPPASIGFSGGTFGSERTPDGVKIETSPQSLYDSHTNTATTPYLDDVHWVRLTAQLQEFDTYEEVITFRHVSLVKTKSGALFVSGPQPQTLTTPSGISVTLLDAQNRPAPRHPIQIDEDHRLNVELQCGQLGTPLDLPQSPFWRKHKRPVTVSLDFLSPLGSFAANGEGTALLYNFYTPHSAPQKRDRFPIIIRQRMDLRSIPMTFTLPVQDGPEKKTKNAS